MGLAPEILRAAGSRASELAVPELTARPLRKLAVLTCMDGRIDVFTLLGLQRGDAHIVRNAGALVTDDAIRSLSASQRLLGTEEIIVVMHEQCGLCGASDADFAAALAADGAEPSWRVGAFADIDAELLAGLARLREARELPSRERVSGFVFDPDAGTLRDVEASAAGG